MVDTQTHSGLGLTVAGPGLLRPLADNWWLLLRGIAAIAFGTLVWPGLVAARLFS